MKGFNTNVCVGLVSILSLLAFIPSTSSATELFDDFEDVNFNGWLQSNSGGASTFDVVEKNSSNRAHVGHVSNTGTGDQSSLSMTFDYTATDVVSFEMEALAFGGTIHSLAGVEVSFLNTFNVPLGSTGLFNVTPASLLGPNDSPILSTQQSYSATMGEFANLAGLGNSDPIAKMNVSFLASGGSLRIGVQSGGDVWFDNFSITPARVTVVPPEEPPVILVGSANINHIPVRVDFETNQAFNQQPVVILGPLSFNGSQPSTTRITQTNATGFNVKVQEYNYLDGFHIQETTDYLAIPQGVYEQIDNLGTTIIIEAGFIELGSGPWKQVVFNANFPEAPVLLTTVQTYNGKDAVIERVRMLDEGGFEARLFEEEKLNPFGHIKERLGYVAFYSSEQTANIISVNGESAELIVSPMFKLDHEWQTIISNIQLKIEEEQSLDIEKNHIEEMVNMVTVGPYLFAEDISGLGLDTSTIRKLQIQ